MNRMLLVWLFALSAAFGGETDLYVPNLRATGAFGFPQRGATLLCDRPDLRVAVWSNDQYLFAQAILWKDGDSLLGKDPQGQPIGDYSHLLLDLDDNGRDTPDVDRVYRLNQRPYESGLRFIIWKDGGAQTGSNDSTGRGAVRYVGTSTAKRVRVDTYLIPLQEISKRVGDKIGICYYAYSPAPPLSINSVTLGNYEPHSVYREYTLSPGGSIDAAKVPDGRNDGTGAPR